MPLLTELGNYFWRLVLQIFAQPGQKKSRSDGWTLASHKVAGKSHPKIITSRKGRRKIRGHGCRILFDVEDRVIVIRRIGNRKDVYD